jgi:hypothetical protein
MADYFWWIFQQATVEYRRVQLRTAMVLYSLNRDDVYSDPQSWLVNGNSSLLGLPQYPQVWTAVHIAYTVIILIPTGKTSYCRI